MENRTNNVMQIEKSIFKAATGYEYEESEIKGDKNGTKELKKVKKYKAPDIRAAVAYLNLFCDQ